MAPPADTRSLAGPTAAETSEGLTSWFSADTEVMILQFGTVDSIRYSLDGDAASFYEWLQAETPVTE